MKEFKILAFSLLQFVIMFATEMVYIYILPTFIKMGGIWMYIVCIGTLASIGLTIYFLMAFITDLWTVMDWEDWGL